ncbi:dentin sialophosphoprotein-like [Crassostrea angulata]|uniref:dentin sialophosphoprotein-like n=1 Tax=Magallana angulata TaxID=2784310 RepID=UPI0022B1EE6E|nr:dentin sialophosphoprotein-like [Crassostrea angulata]XP_052675735.1 dentin sialophosphoprotein-like [Crassostrea angulata]XP_052675736.1 dentin sialophosphoprotein-like [Crassostrea angulata]XP_052675737.1 dentin sialophosphoprotein-like [Crassostrea angulata]XP_052675738.1 dentin sialophosphoprotein-like [Crassostrea angulata]XP_052675739.1 dentin sialophosphoprotein-like [Crassostrea angulata]
MQIVSKMESNSESNIEEKSSDKEKVASNDVDFNENLSKQCNGNTMTDVNKNIAKSESLELSDNATTMLKQNKSEGDLSETSENCELHISEGSDVECEKTEDDKDSVKPNGEDKVKTDSNVSDQNDIKETENVDLDMAGNNSQETGKENKVHQALDASDIGVEEGTEDTKDKQSESANKPIDMEVPVDGSGESPADDKMHLQEENAEMNSSENELLEPCKEKISETCSAESSPDESGENSKESVKGEDTNSVCHQNSESNDEVASKHVEEESDDKGQDKKENDTDKKHKGEKLESDHGNSDSSNENGSESIPDSTESEKDLKVECDALDNEDSKLENISESENKDDKSREHSKDITESGSSVDPESSLIQSSDNVDENVIESQSKNDQSGEHSNEINESGSSVDPESRSEMTQPSDVDVDDSEGKNDQSDEHSNDKSESGSCVDPESRSELTQPSDVDVDDSEGKNDQSDEHTNDKSESGSCVDPESRSETTQSSDNVDDSEGKNDQSDEHSNDKSESGSSVDPESRSETTQSSDNVDDSEGKNDQSDEHSNDKSESGSSVDPESRSETTQLSDNVGVEPNDISDSILKENASKDSENSLEYTNGDSESAQRESESIIEAKKDIGTEVDTNLSESSTSVKQKINDDISKENQTLDSDQQVLEMQSADNQETEVSNVDRSQNDGVISETNQADARENDISEESASTEINATQSETVTEVLSENDDNGYDETSKVERKVIDNDQSVQTDERELETSSTQTVMKESKDQSSETPAKEVGSMETQTIDQKVQCEHKETETDVTEHVQKTEVCDKETSISQPESAEQSVQTEAENLNSVQEEEVLEDEEEEEKEEDAEASKQPTQTPSTEQATQTDLQESVSMMIQTDNQKPTEKEQALEDETDMLKDELSEAKKMIRDLQAELAKSKASSNYMVTTLKCQLKKSHESQQAQRCQSDRQMGEVLAHLLYLEGQLKKDKTHIKFLLRQKDDIIQKQKCDIEELKNTNQRLIEAVREHYARKGKNGLSKEHSESLQNAEAEVPCSPKVKVKNRGAFGSVKDIIWKHRSSLDLSEAGMEIQGNLKKDRQYSSQENLFSLGRRSKEARESRDKKCKSIAGYPDHSLEYLIPEEAELRDISLHGSASSLKKGQKSGRNVSWGSDKSDVNNSYDSNGHLMVSPMMSAGSMPMLNKNSNLDLVTKDRPHSISSIESLSRENCSSLPGTPKMEEKVPHPVPQESSNPFKNLKTILKRKGSKMKNKKRTVSLSNSANPEYEEAMKKHFEKYEMS